MATLLICLESLPIPTKPLTWVLTFKNSTPYKGKDYYIIGGAPSSAKLWAFLLLTIFFFYLASVLKILIITESFQRSKDLT